RRARATAGASEGARLRAALRRADAREALAGVRVYPVLTAHPTEARRRTVLLAHRPIAHLLDRADDPRLSPGGDRALRRRLGVEVAVLWQAGGLGRRDMTLVDVVRTAR